jgi:hypothetical protein
MGLRPTYMDETRLESMSFDGVVHHPPAIGRVVLMWNLDPGF